MTFNHLFRLFTVTAGLAPIVSAIEPSAAFASSAGDPFSSFEPGTALGEAASSMVFESSFEHAARMRWLASVWPRCAPELEIPREDASASSLETPRVLDPTEGRVLWDDYRPMLAAAQGPSVNSDIPNHHSLTDQFFFGLGAFSATSSTHARLTGSAGIGTDVDFEETLGLDDNEITPWGIFRWRCSESWRVEMEYFQLNRSNTTTLRGDIVWGDQTYVAGTKVESQFDFAVTRLSCGYSFFKRQDKELGVALGFHVTKIRADISTNTTGGDAAKLLAPLPVASVYGQVALTDLWALSGRLDALALSYYPYSGHIYSIGIDALCQPWRNFGFGIGWRSLDIQATSQSNDWEGEVGANYSGPVIFATASF